MGAPGPDLLITFTTNHGLATIMIAWLSHEFTFCFTSGWAQVCPMDIIVSCN